MTMKIDTVGFNSVLQLCEFGGSEKLSCVSNNVIMVTNTQSQAQDNKDWDLSVSACNGLMPAGIAFSTPHDPTRGERLPTLEHAEVFLHSLYET